MKKDPIINRLEEIEAVLYSHLHEIREAEEAKKSRRKKNDKIGYSYLITLAALAPGFSLFTIPNMFDISQKLILSILIGFVNVLSIYVLPIIVKEYKWWLND